MSAPHLRALALVLAACGLAACAGQLSPGDDSTADGNPGDGNPGCSVFLTFEGPTPLVASPSTVIRANAMVQGGIGVLEYTWSVTFQGGAITTAKALDDNSAITFPAVAAGVYTVQVDVAGASCPTTQVPFNVPAAGANQLQLRMRVTPPASTGLPASEKQVTILGGASSYSLGTVSLDPGQTASATVQRGGTGVPAFLRLMPVAAPEAAVEMFTNGAGGFTARVLGQAHDVLVVPTSSAVAPRVVRWSPGTPVIDLVDAGSAVGGTVLGPGGAALGGAKVQLKVGGVPSTLALTGADGKFSLLARPGAADAIIAVDVTPPDGSGLPRLLAQSTTLFDLAKPFTITYTASLALRDLGGAQLRRGTAALAGARVVVVGDVPGAASVVSGTNTAVSAFGAVQIAATADGSGILPPTLAPARQLTAVIAVDPAVNDYAATAIDLTSTRPTTIDAPVGVQISTQLRRPDGVGIPDAVLDATPAGALAKAGVTSVIRARSGTNGQLSAIVAAGGHYDLRIHDPVYGRGAPVIALDVTRPIATQYTLLPALAATGKLLQEVNPTPVGGAAIQFLLPCSPCTGLDRSRPIAEGTSQPDGSFAVVVPDPGKN
jgi:hypothetical protein